MAAVGGVLLTAVSIYAVIEARHSKENITLFVRIAMLIIWIVYTINYVLLYVKEKRKTTED